MKENNIRLRNKKLIVSKNDKKKIIKLKPFAYDSTRRIQKKWKTFWNVKQTITHDIHIYSNLKFSK